MIKRRNVIASWKGGGHRQRFWQLLEWNLLTGTWWRVLLGRALSYREGARLVTVQRRIPPSPGWCCSWVTTTIHIVVEGWTFWFFRFRWFGGDRTRGEVWEKGRTLGLLLCPLVHRISPISGWEGDQISTQAPQDSSQRFWEVHEATAWVISELMSLFILCQQVTIVGKYLFRFPRCFRNGIPLPLYVILITSSSFSMPEDPLYLVYLFSIN